jgi:hypothetical protein
MIPLGMLLSMIVTVEYEFNGYSPVFNVRLAEVYQFGINYDTARFQYKQIQNFKTEFDQHIKRHWFEYTPEQRTKLEAFQWWLIYKQSAWKCLMMALDPSETFDARRQRLNELRSDLAALGGGIVPYWTTKTMPAPIFGD